MQIKLPHDSTFKTLVARRPKMLIQWSGINPLKIKCLLRLKALQLKIQDMPNWSIYLEQHGHVIKVQII